MKHPRPRSAPLAAMSLFPLNDDDGPIEVRRSCVCQTMPVQFVLQGSKKTRKMAISLEPEAVLCFKQCGCNPPHDHGSGAPSLDVSGDPSNRSLAQLRPVSRLAEG